MNKEKKQHFQRMITSDIKKERNDNEYISIKIRENYIFFILK